MIAAEEDSKVRHELIKIYEKTITSLDSRSPDDPLIRAVSKCYNKTNVLDSDCITIGGVMVSMLPSDVVDHGFELL
jgi:hypothetical protein